MANFTVQNRRSTDLTRRQILRFLGGVAVFGACADDKGMNPDYNAPDIILEGNEDELAGLVKGQFSALQSMAQNPGQELRIGLPSDKGMEVVQMRFSDSGPVEYLHPVVVRESDGMRFHLLFGRGGFKPSILFADEQGNPLAQEGLEMEFALVGGGAGKAAGFDASEWLWTGIKVLAAGLAVWLGASIAKLIFAALAVLGFNAMVIGLLVTAVAVLPALISWLLDLTGWKVEDVRSFFERTVEEIRALWGEVVAGLEERELRGES